MTEQPTKQDIEELVRRLETGAYPLVHIQEAGHLLVSAQPHAASYKLALEFAGAKSGQVRSLGLAMMEALAPHSDSAKGFLAGARDAAALLESGRLPVSETKPSVPDYSAIGEVIKMWLRDSRETRGRRSRK